ncbi:MAG: DUF3499 domain-containing protein [Mycobacterium sp.]
MNVPRRCCRPGCPHYGVATLTFVYVDSTAVVGPLATTREPHSWDLCVNHAGSITAPRGWDLVRHPGPLVAPPEDDDLVALADAVREGEPARVAPASGWYPQPGQAGSPDTGVAAQNGRGGYGAGVLAAPGSSAKGGGRRRGHLRVLPDPSD